MIALPTTSEQRLQTAPSILVPTTDAPARKTSIPVLTARNAETRRRTGRNAARRVTSSAEPREVSVCDMAPASPPASRGGSADRLGFRTDQLSRMLGVRFLVSGPKYGATEFASPCVGPVVIDTAYRRPRGTSRGRLHGGSA